PGCLDITAQYRALSFGRISGNKGAAGVGSNRADGARLSELLRVEERCAAAEGGSMGARENTAIIGDFPGGAAGGLTEDPTRAPAKGAREPCPARHRAPHRVANVRVDEVGDHSLANLLEGRQYIRRHVPRSFGSGGAQLDYATCSGFPACKYPNP